MEAISRRIAWDTVTTCSVAIDSGSASRSAISVTERAASRISAARITSTADTRMNTMGPSRTVASRTSWGPEIALSPAPCSFSP